MINNKKKNILIRVSVAIILLASIALFFYYESSNKEKSNEPAFTKNGQLVFIKKDSSNITRKIDIEIADEDVKRAQGMMWRRSMSDSQGMLFIFDKEEPRSFWMKNTYIPLDIIYVNSLMEIVSIRHNTKPFEEWSIPSEYPAQYVVEVIAGFCYNYNIEAGDRIRFEIDNHKVEQSISF